MGKDEVGVWVGGSGEGDGVGATGVSTNGKGVGVKATLVAEGSKVAVGGGLEAEWHALTRSASVNPRMVRVSDFMINHLSINPGMPTRLQGRDLGSVIAVRPSR
jgi:hypothetical protein